MLAITEIRCPVPCGRKFTICLIKNISAGGISQSVKWPATDRVSEDSWFDVQQGQKHYLCSKTSIRVPKPSQPPRQWKELAPFPVAKLTTTLHLVSCQEWVELYLDSPTCLSGMSGSRGDLIFATCKALQILAWSFICLLSATTSLLSLSVHVFRAACAKDFSKVKVWKVVKRWRHFKACCIHRSNAASRVNCSANTARIYSCLWRKKKHVVTSGWR